MPAILLQNMRAVEGDDSLALLATWQGIRAMGFQSPRALCCLEIAAPNWVGDALRAPSKKAQSITLCAFSEN
jgi:hypothetical protein